MSVPNTPPLLVRGTFQLRSPFDTLAPPEVVYTVKALRTFDDIVDDGIDPLSTYYTISPIDLQQSDYDTDKSAGAVMVTLIADSEDPATLFGGQYIIHVPSTWIEAYPNMSNVKYSRIVLAADLGPLLDTLDLTFTKSQVAAALSDLLGVTVTIQEFRTPSTGVVTPEQSQVLEAARLANVHSRKTDYARAQELQAQHVLAQQTIATLTTVLRNHNLWPPAQV